MDLQIRLKNVLTAPEGTKIITNDDFVTFARRKENGTYSVYTSSIGNFDYDLSETHSNWVDYTKSELQAILKLK